MPDQGSLSEQSCWTLDSKKLLERPTTLIAPTS